MPCLAAAAAAANVFLSECLDRRFLSAETAAEKERMLTDTSAAAAVVVFLFLCRSKASALGGGGGGGGDGVGGDGHSSRAACLPAAQPCLECVR